MSPIRMSLIVAGCTAAAVAASQAPSQPARFRVAVYYVIGYEPDRDTFAPKGKPPLLHTIA